MLIHVLMHLKAGSFTSGPLQQVIKSLWRLCSSNRHTDLSAFRPQNPRSFVTDEHPGRARKGVPLFVLDCLNYTHQKNNGTRNMEEHMKRTHGKKNMISVFFRDSSIFPATTTPQTTPPSEWWWILLGSVAGSAVDRLVTAPSRDQLTESTHNGEW